MTTGRARIAPMEAVSMETRAKNGIQLQRDCPMQHPDPSPKARRKRTTLAQGRLGTLLKLNRGKLSGRQNRMVRGRTTAERLELTPSAWYFWNTESGAVTWTNPLEPPAESSSPKPHLANSTPTHPIQPPLPLGPPPTSQRPADTPPTFGIPADIDPDLAYLLPPSQRGSATAAPGAQTALFNARTGRFTPVDYAYSVDHLDEYNRAKRMNSHYFDVDAWERQKAEENAKRKREEESGVVKKDKITRKDMVSEDGWLHVVQRGCRC